MQEFIKQQNIPARQESQPEITFHFKPKKPSKYPLLHPVQEQFEINFGACLAESMISVDAITRDCWSNLIETVDLRIQVRIFFRKSEFCNGCMANIISYIVWLMLGKYFLSFSKKDFLSIAVAKSEADI